MPRTSSQTLHQALMLHQSGELEEAEHMYCEILRIDPDHADALHLLGVVYHQRNKNRDAVEYIRRAISVKQDASLYHCNLGVACQALGHFDEAISVFQEALRLDQGNAQAHYNLGKTLETGDRIEEAAEAYQQALSADPRFLEAYNNLGRIYSSKKQYADAEHYFRKTVQLQPDFVPGLYNLAIALDELGRPDESEAAYREALRYSPESAEIHNNLGTVLKELEKFDEAQSCFQRAAELKPDYAEAHNNLGTVYQHLDCFDEALECYRCALKIEPRFSGAHTNMGNVFHEQGILDRAIECYTQAVHFNPDYAEAHFNRALARIRNGDFAAGWAEYEWRWKHKVIPREFPHPVWNGTSPASQTVLIYAEQGVGDEIMFASCVPEMLERSGHCIVECDSRLVELYARSFPEAEVVARPVSDAPQAQEILNRVDVQVAMGSLPRFLRSSLDAFPRQPGYLTPASDRVAQWQFRYEELGEGVKVGISWRGGGEPDVRRKRSTTLDQWTGLLNLPKVQFINLQYGETQQELTHIREQIGITIFDWDDSDPLKHLDDFAAQIAALDLVISVDNSTVHLAGALGTEVWTLLPFAADWRWLIGRDDALWYPSMRLYRQPEFGRWDKTFETVSKELYRKIHLVAKLRLRNVHSRSSASREDAKSIEFREAELRETAFPNRSLGTR